MATQHSYYMAAMFSLAEIKQIGVEIQAQNVSHLKRVLRIFCLNVLLKHSAPLAIIQYLSPAHYLAMQTIFNREINLLRPQILNLAESFEFDDNVICSAIGSYDGHAVPRLFEQASSSRLNNKDVLDGFKDYIMPIMHNKDIDALRAKL